MNRQELVATVALRPGAIRSTNRATQSRFKVPKRYQKATETVHKTFEVPPGFGLRQSSGALEARVRPALRTGIELAAAGAGGKAAGDCRSPRRCRADVS